MKGYHHLRRIDPNAAPKNYEFSLIDRWGNLRDVHLSIAMIPGTKKSVASLLDITERKRAEEEREKIIHELKEAQEKVKLLSGMLPICTSCKKVRDDKGY